MALNIFEELDLTASGDNVDEGFLKCKNNWSTTDTELHNARDGEASLLAKIDTLGPAAGHIRRSQFTYVDGDTITVGGGSYDVNGKLAKITSALTTTAHGQNGVDWAYLYIDYSSIPSDNVLIQSDLIWSITEPAWSHTLLGWYNSNDRCIFACRVDGSDDILEFYHVGNYVSYATWISVLSGAAISPTYADVTALTMPSFARRARVGVKWKYVDAYNVLVWRTNGSGGAQGLYLADIAAGATQEVVKEDVITDSGHVIEMKEASASTNTCTMVQEGWYIPDGI